ncbi:ABC transporter ATP-binding protein [Halalkalibacterium halodurans]|uniref:ABC transporter (ATP-binding protein) n=1 Tax=Halalkalibacterium halodurans (strain ATCC BAA-125 / DSM 18197 / FERM 7344 / JCM 9153 / C-125) TaxID=272558 RepID=Q9KDP6_HALH5|nr:ABC transporter ATP-binding protein [Halalkalibacterium halodurans]MED4079366.1 ABC transporter ATP-binding protein [Halalkalibacterium halodurans]MED4085437.1 ABC transporter ATP-binding protein [Halalkalibacterium halodurans]MED4104439.1 ABC transporter ATP-binding protein [Halalkalibacterium halodurans]MED4108116.1 ABC transporter ATP-binding protein [Halalkalibacterium halodurans]MED4124311.1 ABC transporter ATP-binding protein [Halalkalibacterium halodurans]
MTWGCHHLIKKVDASFSLGPISFTLEPGTVTALVGDNGSGKSTFFRLWMDLIKANQGTWERKEGWKEDTAYVPQQLIGIEAFTLEELAYLYEGMYVKWDQKTFERLVESFSLPMKKPLHSLSVGMQKKALFSMAIARKPNLFLLDEPFAGVDMDGQEQMKDELIRYLTGHEQATVLFATHSAQEVKELADYLLVLHQGQMLGFYEKDRLLSSWGRFWLEGNASAIKNEENVVSMKIAGTRIEIITSDALRFEEQIAAAALEKVEAQPLELHEIVRLLKKRNVSVS